MATIAPHPQSTRPLHGRPVRHAMHRGVVTCAPETPLAEVAALMVEHRIHSVVVESGAGRWGIVSDLDLVAAASVRALADQTAGGSAASPLVTISPDDTLERAAQLMTEHESAHVVVVERGEPVGVLSTLDVARSLVGEPTLPA